VYKLRHLARELAADLAMGVPANRAMRIRKGRTIGALPTEKAREILRERTTMTLRQVQRELRTKLADGYFTNPQVMVAVEECAASGSS
jgi:hypothetical protein